MDELVFTWDYYKSVGPIRREIFTTAGFSPSDEFNEMQVNEYKDEMNNLGFFSAFEKYIEETGEITLYKLMVPNPNPEERENPKYAIWIYKVDSISKLEITLCSSINEFRTQAPLICNYLSIDKDVIDLAADLVGLGF